MKGVVFTELIEFVEYKSDTYKSETLFRGITKRPYLQLLARFLIISDLGLIFRELHNLYDIMNKMDKNSIKYIYKLYY